ncbi:hypothetical protein [Nocardioides sp. B-3]|uniref:hypothetical protein n=1 Tax=Nocardioides sp. B-3 TaxID=2895565 RepID=UPI002342EFAF|nr:hypothetical protein [Nocardioides sp. B-3]
MLGHLSSSFGLPLPTVRTPTDNTGASPYDLWRAGDVTVSVDGLRPTRQAVPVPSPDQPADLPADQPVREAVRAYAAQQPGLVTPTEHFVELITTLLDDAGINYLSVTGRTKSVASFAAKAARDRR